MQYTAAKNVIGTLPHLCQDLEQMHQGKFGTFKGVFIPSILTILGVIMYLRLGWVVGSVGLVGTIVIITLASAITFITALSISATATNMRVGGGGAYFMISRSFGLEAGAAIGLPLYLAQALGISFYVAGFAESLAFVFPQYPEPVIGTVSLVFLAILAYVSADLALKTQFLIFTAIIVSLVSFFMGQPPETFPPQESTLVAGVGFWAVFAVFFPAVTGIEAGIAMSGDLKDPGKSLPRGTIAAVVVGFLVYVVIAFYLWKMAPAEQLVQNPMIMRDISKFSWAIMIGIWGATLSSALGALLGAPRTLQALSRDRILFRFLGRGYGKDDSPRIATAVSFGIAMAGVWLGNLDVIAPVLSMFFLTSYGFLNLAAGLEGLMGNPSWRPSFKTPWLLSMLGAFGCLAVMLMIDPGATFSASFLTIGVYFVMRRRAMRTRFSDIRYSLLVFMARYSIYQLASFKVDARTWRPNMLVLSGAPKSRWYLIELSHVISHGKGFLTVASVIQKDMVTEDRIGQMEESVEDYLKENGVAALVEVNTADNVMDGAKNLVKTYGLGSIIPNTFVMGICQDEQSIRGYSELVKLIYESHRNVLVLRESEIEKASESGKGSRFLFRRTKKTEKHIDIWWGGKRQNANLMLALAFMVQTSPEWRGANLHLRSLVDSDAEKEQAIAFLKEYLSHGRLGAKVEVVTLPQGASRMSVIKEASKEADLVFIGMRPPDPDESPESYSEYYQKLTESTAGFPDLVMVMAGETIKFDEIFN